MYNSFFGLLVTPRESIIGEGLQNFICYANYFPLSLHNEFISVEEVKCLLTGFIRYD